MSSQGFVVDYQLFVHYSGQNLPRHCRFTLIYRQVRLKQWGH